MAGEQNLYRVKGKKKVSGEGSSMCGDFSDDW